MDNAHTSDDALGESAIKSGLRGLLDSIVDCWPEADFEAVQVEFDRLLAEAVRWPNIDHDAIQKKFDRLLTKPVEWPDIEHEAIQKLFDET